MDTQVDIAATGTRVQLRLPDRRVLELPYGRAKELGETLVRLSKPADRTPLDAVDVGQGLRAIRTADAIDLLVGGHPVLTAPPEIAVRIGRGLYAKGLEAEEESQAARLVEEQAMLVRAGLPVGLSDRSDINAAAWRRAQQLNTPLAGTPKFVPGTPTIVSTPPEVARV